MASINLTYNQVTAGTIASLEPIRSLYMDSFPEEERRPWDGIVSLIESGAPFFNFIIVKDNDDKEIGFFSKWRFPEAVYIEHLAVVPSMRGNGVGSEILAEIIKQAEGKPVVVEVEPSDTTTQASDRIRFYEKAGFNAIYDFDYIQPPYAKGLPEVPMLLMSSAPLDDIELFVLQLHTLVYNK